MTANSQLLTTTLKTKTKANNQNRNESQKWRSQGGLSAGEGERWGKGTENKQHKWQVENRQGEVKNSIGNVEAKELICMTHKHELRGQNMGGGVKGRGRKIGAIVMA